MKTIATSAIDQAQAAYEKVNDATHGSLQVFDAAAVAFKARFADIQMKSLEFTNANVASYFAFARSLFAVKEPTAAFALQQDYVKAQFEAAKRQAAELNELTVQLAKETTKPLQAAFTSFVKPAAA